MDNLGMGLMIEYQDRASSGIKNTKSAFDSFNQTIDQTVNKSGKVLDSLNNLARNSAELVAGGFGLNKFGKSITSSLGGMINQAESYEKELTNLQFVARASKEEMDLFNRTAIQSGIETQFSPQEVVQGMYELKSAGLSNISMLKSLRATLDLVALSGGKISMSSGSALMANMLNKFNLDPENSTRIVDVIARVTQDTNFHIEDIPAFVNSLRDAPTKLKRPMEELFALGGLLRNLGQQSAQSGQTVAGFARQIMNLSKMLENGSIGRVGAIKQKYMKELGINKDTFWKDGKLASLSDVFLSIIKGSQNMNEQQRSIAIQAVFGDQSGAIVSAVENARKNYFTYDSKGNLVETQSKEGKQSLESLVAGLNNAQGSANEGAEKLLQTFWGIKILMQGSIQTLQVLLGKTILPMFGRAIKLFTLFLNKMITLSDKHPTLAKFLVLSTAFIGVFAILSGKIMMMAGALGFAILGFKNIVLGFSAIKSFLIPLMPLLMQFALILGGVYLAWKYDFLNIQTLTHKLLGNFKDMFNNVKSLTKMGSKDMLEALSKIEEKGGFFSNLTSALVRFVTLFQLLGEAWNTNKLSEDSFVKMRELGLLPLVSVILDLKEKFRTFIAGLKEGIKTASDYITEKLGSIAKLFTLDLKIKGDPTNLSPLTKFLQALNSIDDSKVALLGRVAGYAITIGAPLLILSKVLKMFSGLGGIIVSTVKFIAMFGSKLWWIGGILLKIGTAVVTTIATIVGLPAWAVATIIAVVVASALAIYRYWDNIKEYTISAYSSIKDGIVKLYDDSLAWCSSTWESIKSFSINSYNSIIDYLKHLGESILIYIEEKIQATKDFLSSIVSSIPVVIEESIGKVEMILESLPNVFSTLWDTIKSKSEGFFTWITSKFEWLTSKFSEIKNIFGFNSDTQNPELNVPPVPELPPAPAQDIAPEDKVETIRESYVTNPTTNTSHTDNSIKLEQGSIQIIVPEGSKLDEKTVEQIFEKVERNRQLKSMYGGRR